MLDQQYAYSSKHFVSEKISKMFDFNNYRTAQYVFDGIVRSQIKLFKSRVLNIRRDLQTQSGKNWSLLIADKTAVF